jgi:hypothetical protein
MGEWPEELGDPSRTSDLVEARSMDVRTPVPILKVGFVLVPDFTLSALALFIDALRLAGDEATGRARYAAPGRSCRTDRSRFERARALLSLPRAHCYLRSPSTISSWSAACCIPGETWIPRS